MKIVSIQGPWSVGKSTLLGNLQKCSRLDIFTMKEFGDCERSERDKYNFDLSVKEDFVKNQEVFFKGELARHHRIQSLSNAYIALDRGPEDTIWAAQFLFCKRGDQVWGGLVEFMLR